MQTIAAFVAAAALTTDVAPVTTVEPSGPWRLDETTLGCVVTRPYDGAGLTLGLEARVNLRHPLLLFAGSAQHLEVAASAGLSVLAEPGGQTVRLPLDTSDLQAGSTRLIRAGLDDTSAPMVTGADYLTTRSTRFHVTGRAAALKAVTDCTAKLLVSWGLDPQPYLDKTQPEVVGSLARYFGPDDYPREALRAGIQGRVVVLLSVTDNGRVSACRVVRSDDATMNPETCTIAKRMRFKPASSSYYVLPVNWILPR